MRIAIPKDTNFLECLQFLNRSPLECTHRVVGDVLHQALLIDGRPVVFAVCRDSGCRLRVEVENSAPEHARLVIRRYLREWLDLDRDLHPFYKLAENDALLQRLIRQYYGLRLIGIPDLFEALSWAMIGQQINLRFAYTLKRNFVTRFGMEARVEGISYYTYPEPEMIARLATSDLLKLQFSRQKSEYVIGVARLISEGKISKASLKQAGIYEEMRRQLLAIRGVGEWTADYVLLKCMGLPQAFPLADVGFQNALKNELGFSVKPTVEEIREIAREWGGWEGYVTFYLWRTLV